MDEEMLLLRLSDAIVTRLNGQEGKLTQLSSIDVIADIVRMDQYNLSIIYKSGKSVIIDLRDVIDPAKNGVDGLNGKDGTRGSDGQDGQDGSTGKDGVDGSHGKDGIGGLHGKDGKDGKDGQNGAPGKDGLPGRDGLIGEKGGAGEQGDTGDRGNGIVDIRVNRRRHLIIETDDKTFDLGIFNRETSGGGGGGGGSGNFFYTNTLPMPSDVGGIPAGTTFDKVPLKKLWTMLLYAYDEPVFTAFSISGVPTELEVGQEITTGPYTVDWTIDNVELLEPNSITIRYDNDNIILADNLANTGSAVVTLPNISYVTQAQVKFTITAKDTTGDILSSAISVPVLERIFVGESSSPFLLDTDVLGLRLTELKSNINDIYEMQSGGYKWFCFPKSMGMRDSFIDLHTSLVVPMVSSPEAVLITNQYGLDIPYWCYRTFNFLGGEITMEVM